MQYRQLVDHLILLALKQYSKNLQQRALASLKMNRTTKRNRAIQLLQARAGNKRTVMRQVLHHFRRTVRQQKDWKSANA